jgi:aryl-alcohol dehydrogenase-like predicted oxidoreductase
MAGYDVVAINTPVNMIGWHMRPSREAVLAALAATDKVVVGMKPLAMARIPPEEGMAYTLARPEVDMVVVGLATPEEARETLGAALQVIHGKGGGEGG